MEILIQKNTFKLTFYNYNYKKHYPEHRKLVYCSRTIPELEKTLQELKRLMDYRESCGLKEQFLGLGLTSRRNLCIHPEVLFYK